MPGKRGTTVTQQNRKSLKRSNRRRGMTLIEIMVVMTIMALMMAGVAVAIIPRLDEARVDTARTDMHTIQTALDMYYAKKGRYPDTGTGLGVLSEGQFLKEIPVDPWGNEYSYLNEGGKPVIVSYGSDGAPGGEGAAADVSSKDKQPK